MQVTSNLNISQVAAPSGTKAAAPSGMTQSQAASQFGGTERLNRALHATPDVRAEKVKRARALVSDPNYPSSAIVRSVANLLASNIGSQNEQ